MRPCCVTAKTDESSLALFRMVLDGTPEAVVAVKK